MASNFDQVLVSKHEAPSTGPIPNLLASSRVAEGIINTISYSTCATHKVYHLSGMAGVVAIFERHMNHARFPLFSIAVRELEPGIVHTDTCDARSLRRAMGLISGVRVSNMFKYSHPYENSDSIP